MGSASSLFLSYLLKLCIAPFHIAKVEGNGKTQYHQRDGHQRTTVPGQYTAVIENVGDHGQEHAENHGKGTSMPPLKQQAHCGADSQSAKGQTDQHWKQDRQGKLCQSTHIHLIESQSGKNNRRIHTGDDGSGCHGHTQCNGLKQIWMCDLRKTYLTVFTRVGVPPKRSLLEFSKIKEICKNEELTIELERHVYTKEYIALTKDFYLKM